MISYFRFYALACILVAISCSNNESNYDASGTFEATEIMVSAEANGRILHFNISEGQELQQGEKMGVIDTTQLYLRKLQLQSGIEALKTRRMDVARQVAAVEQQIETAQYEKLRFETLLKADATTQKQVDDINAQIKVLEKQLAAQKSNLENSNQGIAREVESLGILIAQTDDQLDKCRIASPIKGIVLAKYAEPGELATLGKPLFKIADTEHIFLRAYITADQLTQLKIGQQVKISADFGAKGTRSYEGTIAWVSGKSEFTPKSIHTRDERANLVYAAKISVINDGYLKIGMYGNVKFD